MSTRPGFLTLVLALAMAAGCASVAHKASTYTRTATTIVEVTSNVPSDVWMANQKIGTTPVSFAFSYEEEVERQVKTATYWETNPGIAAAVTVLSLGVYLPFSAIPVEAQSEFRPTGTYVKNKLFLRLTSESYESLDHSVDLKGEPRVEVNLTLKKAGAQ
jgi:hypothetical protein